MNFPSGLITLVFTDIADSSVLSERYRAVFEPARQAHFRLLRECLTRWNGLEVSTAGDSLFLVFVKPSNAVRWAAEAQQALLQHDWNGIDLRVRMGMHTGEPFCSLEDRVDYYGPPVNRAARVMDAAHGGQILLSDATHSLVLHDLPAEFTFHGCGAHRLKGIGEEHLWQLWLPGLRRDFPPLRTLDPQRHNLPLAHTPFLGREAEIARWQERLALPTTRLLTLTGFGGLGKTRAALHLAELCVERFADGVWWVALEEAQTAEEMLRRIAESLRLPPHPTAQDQVAHYLRERQALLVLDNVEQVMQAVEALKELLDAAPRTQWLVTSRRALELRAEVVAELSPLSDTESERLFVERAQAAQSDFAVTDENAADVAELCRRLEGVPLAIELAASRIVGMTPRQMLPRLRERFRLLQTRIPDLPPRQRALHATIDWSYGLLAQEDREVFSQLGVFAGGFTLEDAEAVCEAFDVFESVMTLRHNSFLRAETDFRTQEARFVMFESLRDYAGEQLAETDDGGQAVRQRHAEYYRDYARRRIRLFRGPSEAAARRQLEANNANLRAGMEWARQAGEIARFAELALLLGIALQRRGFHREAVAPIQAGLEAADHALSSPSRSASPGKGEREVDALRVELLRERVGLHLDLKEPAEARQRAEEARTIFAQLSDAQGQAQAENLLGQAAVMENAFTEARAHYTQALTRHERAGDTVESAIVQNNLGVLEYTDPAGDRERGQQHLEEALRLRRAHDDRHGLAETLNNLGVLAHHQEDWEAAARYYRESLAHRQALGHPYGTVFALSNLGEVVEAQGQLERACRLYAAAERLFEETRSPHAVYSGDLLVKAAAQQGLSAAELRQAARDRSLDELIAWAAESDAAPAG